MAEKMNPNLAAAYGKAKKIRDIEKGNPRIANMSPKERVNKLIVKNDERGAPEPVNQQTKEQNNRAVSDFLEKKGIFRTMEVKPKARVRRAKRRSRRGRRTTGQGIQASRQSIQARGKNRQGHEG
jgi:hypothetical protein